MWYYLSVIMKIKEIICKQIISLGRKQMECCSRWGLYQDDVRDLKKKRQELSEKKIMLNKS